MNVINQHRINIVGERLARGGDREGPRSGADHDRMALIITPINPSLTPLAYNQHRIALNLSSVEWFYVKVTLTDAESGIKTTSFLR